MSQYKYGEIAEIIYFWFAANQTTGAAGDGATPLYDVRLAGAASDAAPTASGTPTLLSHANYTDGLHEIAIDTTGFAAGEYAVFCTLTISSVNPAGFCGSFKLRTAGTAALAVDTVAISGDATAANNAELAFDGTGYGFTNCVIPTVSVLTGHTVQTGDSFAIVNGDHGLVSIQDDVDAILNDTGTTLDNHLLDIKGTAFAKDTHSLTDITADVTGIAGAAMRGTDSAALATALTTAQTDLDTITGTGGVLIGTDVMDRSGTLDVNTKTATATALDLVLKSSTFALAMADAIWDEALAGHVGADSAGLVQNEWQDGGRLDLLLDAIPTTAMRGTDSAALASVCTEARLAELDAANIPTDAGRLTAARAQVIDDWINGGRLDLLLDAILDDTDLIDDGTSGLAKIATDAAAILVDTAVIGALGAGLTDITGRLPAALTKGTADSGTTTTCVDAALTEADTDYWKGCFIRFTSGTISGQTRQITGFTPASDTVTFSPATTQAVATNTYEILPAVIVETELPAATQASIDAIEADTNELQTDWVNGGRLDLLLDAIPTTPMRGTDSAALASVCTEGRLAELDAANIPADVDAILVDTGTSIPALLPAALSSGNMKCDVLAISTSTAAADNLEASAETIIPTSVNDAAATTTAFVTALTSAVDDFYNGRIIIFTSGALANQATDITDYEGATKKVTVTALTSAPANSVTFVVV